MGNKLSRGKGAGRADELDPEVIEQFMAQAGTTRTLQPNSFLIEQGTSSECLYLIKRGEVILKKKSKGGSEKELAKRGAGQARKHRLSPAHAPKGGHRSAQAPPPRVGL